MTWGDWAAALVVLLGIAVLAVAVVFSDRWSVRRAARLERQRRSGAPPARHRRVRPCSRRVMDRG
ncbi:MAG: hypothetical protein ACRDQ0_02385 [Pseudonocardia sp.]